MRCYHVIGHHPIGVSLSSHSDWVETPWLSFSTPGGLAMYTSEIPSFAPETRAHQTRVFVVRRHNVAHLTQNPSITIRLEHETGSSGNARNLFRSSAHMLADIPMFQKICSSTLSDTSDICQQRSPYSQMQILVQASLSKHIMFITYVGVLCKTTGQKPCQDV